MKLKGSTIISIDGILVNINKYTPLGAGSSYIKLPDCIENKKAVVNTKNTEEKCFKYSILAKHINGSSACRVGHHFDEIENMYDFSKLSYPVQVKDIKHKFESRNPKVSINVYSLKRGTLSYKNNIQTANISRVKLCKKKSEQYIVYPIKVCEQELDYHHDILLFGDGTDKQHYCRITSLSRLVRSQITLHTSSAAICKRCFKSYLAGVGVTSVEQRLAELCNKNKPLRPIMPQPNTLMKF